MKTSDNDDGHKTGLRLIQEGEGEGALTISASEIKDGIKSENVNIVEE